MSHTAESPDVDESRRRLRWRARRGLLENDLLLTGILDTHESTLDSQDLRAFHALLDLSDNDLLDILLARKDCEGILLQHPLPSNTSVTQIQTLLTRILP